MLRSAQVRAEFAEEIVVRARFGLMLGFAAPRRFCREHRAPCFLGNAYVRGKQI